MDELERASKSIDHLQAIIARFSGEAAWKDLQPNVSDGIPEVGVSGIEVEAIAPAQLAIQAILSALSPPRRLIHRRISGDPPKWWGDFKDALGRKGHENAASLKALSDAVLILHPYICEETDTLPGLVFLTQDMHRHLKLIPVQTGLRAMNNPNPNQFVLFFNPEVDHQIRDAFDELNREIRIFPKACVAFLTDALNEVRDIIG